MNKYKRKYILEEHIPDLINDFELSLLLFDFKRIFTKTNDFVKFKELDNSLCLRLILNKFYKYSDSEKNYLTQKVLSRINKNSLYSFYLRRTCNLLLKKEYDDLDETLKSFVATGLIKDSMLNDDKSVIIITLPDDTEVKYTHVQLEKELLDAYNEECHFVTSYF